MLYNLIILPIETVVDWVFMFFINRLPFLGVIGAVVGVSLVINFLALPLYNIADSLQENERNISKKLEYRVNRIKKAFKGNEQFMMLQTYYRQNNYHPLYALRSSLSILIEIPFFIAAYQYLSHQPILHDASFWIFKDLGSPDNLFSFKILGHSLHILPILMTLINFVSGAIYTKEAPFKEKIQLYVVAVVFLLLLYNSPSGLVIYWILNNCFSLVKNVVMKMKNPVAILHKVISGLLICLCFVLAFSNGSKSKVIVFSIFTLFVMFFPILKRNLNLKLISKFVCVKKISKSNLIIFLLSGLSLGLFAGLLFVLRIVDLDLEKYMIINPNGFLRKTIPLFLGFFVFWPFVIYKLFGEKVKLVLPYIFIMICICFISNSLLFSKLGESNLCFEISKDFFIVNAKLIILPILIFLISVVISFAFMRFKKIGVIILSAICVFELSAGIFKCKKLYDFDLNENKNAVEYFNSMSANEYLKIRVRSQKQIHNFVTVNLLPPALRETFYENCRLKIQEEK